MWLRNNGLLYDQIYLGWNKAKLFEDNSVYAIIDDSPATLVKATQLGIWGFGLEKPYNKYLNGAIMIQLFTSLNGINRWFFRHGETEMK
jgi:hypothetical protein